MSTDRRSADGSGKAGRKPWQKNLIFALIVLLAAGIAFFAYRSQHRAGSDLAALVDFGDGVTETLPVGDYVVHIQVKDGAAAFRDSQCPDHVCEQFGWLREEDAWAACVPAGVYLQIVPADSAE